MTSTGNSNNHSDNKTVKIMTYNVWFREELELIRRMNAIGDLIQHHSPDLICFQVLYWNYALLIFLLYLGFGYSFVALCNCRRSLQTFTCFLRNQIGGKHTNAPCRIRWPWKDHTTACRYRTFLKLRLSWKYHTTACRDKPLTTLGMWCSITTA